MRVWPTAGCRGRAGPLQKEGGIQVLNLQGLAVDLGPMTSLPGPGCQMPSQGWVTCGLRDTGSQK